MKNKLPTKNQIREKAFELLCEDIANGLNAGKVTNGEMVENDAKKLSDYFMGKAREMSR